MMSQPQVAVHRSIKWGYAAYIICGLCAALNVLAYIPQQTFEEAEGTEFLVTLPLIVVFIISGLFGIALTLKNAREVKLLMLLVGTVVFTFLMNRGWTWRVQTNLQLSYALLTLAAGTIGLLTARAKPSGEGYS